MPSGTTSCPKRAGAEAGSRAADSQRAGYGVVVICDPRMSERATAASFVPACRRCEHPGEPAGVRGCANSAVKLLALDTAPSCVRPRCGWMARCWSASRAARTATRLILPMIEQLLAEAGVQLSQLDAIAFDAARRLYRVRLPPASRRGWRSPRSCRCCRSRICGARGPGAAARGRPRCALICQDARMQEVYWGL